MDEIQPCPKTDFGNTKVVAAGGKAAAQLVTLNKNVFTFCPSVGVIVNIAVSGVVRTGIVKLQISIG